MKKPTYAALLTLVILLSAAPALAQAITISVDKSSYKAGESLNVQGTVSPVTAGQAVTLQVLGSLGETKGYGQATPASDGKFSVTNLYTFTSTDKEGIWSVKATYRGASQAATFGVVAAVPTAAAAAAAAVGGLMVQVQAPSVAYVGQTVQVWALVTYNGTFVPVADFGTPAAPLFPASWGPGFTHIHHPDRTAAPVTYTSVHNGLYQTTFVVPDKEGTYIAIVPVRANGSTTTGSASFTVNKRIADQNTLTALSTAVTALSTRIDGVTSDVNTRIGQAETTLRTAITTSEGNLRSQVAAVSSSVEGASATVATAQTAIVTAVNAARDDVKNSITSGQSAISGTVGGIKGSVDGLKSNLDSISSGLSQTSTLVLVVAAISVITLVVELAILMRRK